MTTQPRTEGRRSAAAQRRREREAEIIAATRQLFDERGLRDAQIEDIASAVGINRAIVYRHFTGKEELFALTLVGYLDDLRTALVAADLPDRSAGDRITEVVSAFMDYGQAHPAFVDCAQDLMRRRGDELLQEISESALFRLGRAMTGCLSILEQIFRDGAASGELEVEDPTLLANTLYATGLGALQLSRVGIMVAESAPGVPTMGQVSTERVRDYVVTAALALAGA